MAMRYNFRQIQRLINRALGDDEFLNLCQDYFPSVYNEFTTGQTRSYRIGLLINYIKHPHDTSRLLARINEINPNIYAEFESRLVLLFDEPLSLCPHFQERAEERQILDNLNNGQNALIGIFGLVGCGKSQLVSQIFRQTQNFQNCFWCNFQKLHSLRNLLLAILEEEFEEEFGPHEDTHLTDEQLVEKVIDCLVSGRFLLVLDDVEVLLESKDLWEAYRNFLEHWQRNGRSSSILLTSRKRIEIQGCRWFSLSVLNGEQSITLLKEADVSRSEDDLKEIVDLVAGHPLLLNFATKRENLERINSFKGSYELFDQLIGFHRDNNKFSVGQVLKKDYERLRLPLKKLLQSVSIYRIAFNLKAIHRVMPDERINEKELNDLVEQSFLLESQQEQLWESHPLIKRYVQDLLSQDDRKSLHRQAISYYDAIKHSDWRNLEDTVEYQQIFYHLCELQRYCEAFSLFWQPGEASSLDKFLERRGYNSMRVDLYESLRERWQPADKERNVFIKMLNCLGDAYHALGKNRLAQELYERALQISHF